MSTHNLLIDLDNTLTDYDYTNKYAVLKVFEQLGYKMTDEDYYEYSQFEYNYWNSFEHSNQELNTQGMKRIDYVRSIIYQQYFGEDKVSLDTGYLLMKTYIDNLGKKNLLYDGVKEVLEYLYEYYDLYIASNGPNEAQMRKLKGTGIDQYFKGIMSSEDADYSKPKKEFFYYMFIKYGLKPDESIMIGDSLTSDIKGANNAGIDSIWINNKGIINTTDIKPNIEIRNIKELKRIL